MFNSETNHHQVLQDAIMGRRPTDSQVLCSLAVMEDKLEMLKRLGPQYAEVSFSSAVKQLAKRHSAEAASL
jgi:hypothetical protein